VVPPKLRQVPSKPLSRFTDSCNYLRIRVKITRKINGDKEIHIKRCNLGGCLRVFLSFVCVRFICSCNFAAMLSIFIVYLLCLGLGWIEFVARKYYRRQALDTTTKSDTAFCVDYRCSGSGNVCYWVSERERERETWSLYQPRRLMYVLTSTGQTLDPRVSVSSCTFMFIQSFLCLCCPVWVFLATTWFLVREALPSGCNK